VPAWVDPDSFGWISHPVNDADWADLLTQSEGGPRLEPILNVARRNGCRTVIVESRYIDGDYRSEYSAFWSKRFDSISPFARRLHFFRSVIDLADLPHFPSRPGYLGYSVIRPGPHFDGRIGRTILVPPKHLRNSITVAVEDQVSLFGNSLGVRGAPWSEQDGEFLRCAHAAIWACHYSAYRRGLIGRRLTAELVGLAPTLLQALRALPSPGLTGQQMQAIFAATGQPALLYTFAGLPKVPGVENPAPTPDPKNPGRFLSPGLWDHRAYSIICRYLNSGFPVMLINANHVIVLVGWYRTQGKIRFVACDDQRKPYEVVSSLFTDDRAPWSAIMVPLPPKVLMSGEMAEFWGFNAFRGFGNFPAALPSWNTLAQSLTANPKAVSLRTFLRDGREYKASVATQGREAAVVRELRFARLPHFVWVVEAQDRSLRDAGKPAVIAEAVFDSNSSDHEWRAPRADAMSLPGLTVVTPPDSGKPVPVRYPEQPWLSHLSVG
jgi:hypothetical protein